MAIQVTTLRCPTCGGSVCADHNACEYCGNALMISSFQSVATMPMPELGKHINAYQQALATEPDHREMNISIAMCFLKLKQYDHALAAFEKAMPCNFDNSEVFFYGAVCLLQGKIPFLHLRPTIDKILSYMDSALMIESRGIYHYFLAYIKQDYFKRKYLNVSPDYTQHLQMARQTGVSQNDIDQLFAILGTQRPAGL